MPKKPSIDIEVEGLTKRYRHQRGVEGLNVKFTSEKLNLVVGENGSGKSTLFKCIMGLVRYEGLIKRPITSHIGYAPEEYVMPDYMSVYEFLYNLGKIRRIESKSCQKEIDSFLCLFGIESQKHRSIGSLSNGMKQKVNLIQAFLNKPAVILLDEPLRALDQESQKILHELIESRRTETLMIITTHELDRFKSKNKQVFVIREGKIDD